MRLKNLISISLTTMLLYTGSHAAEPGESISAMDLRVSTLNRLVKAFAEVCLDSATQAVREDAVIEDSSGKKISCSKESIKLNADMEQLQAELDHQKEMASTNSVSCPQCQSETPARAKSAAEPLSPLNANLDAMKNSCVFGDDQRILREPKSCGGQIACDAARSLFSISGTALFESVFHSRSEEILLSQAGCGMTDRHEDCFENILKGVFKDLWSNVQGVVQLSKTILLGSAHLAEKGAEIISHRLVKTWDWAFGIENKTSAALLSASQQSDSMIAIFKKNPIEFIKLMGSALYQSAGNAIEEEFGCESWAKDSTGKNFCVVPMESFKCASCTQKMNAVCGLVGYASGEVVNAYLMGGAAAVTKALMKKSAAEGSEYFSRIASSIEDSSKFGSKTVSVSRKGLTTAEESIGHTKSALNVLRNSATGRAIASSAKTTRRVLRATVKVITPYPIRKYLDLLSRATALGFKHGSVLVTDP